MKETSSPPAARPEPVLLKVHAVWFPLILLLACFALEIAIFLLDYFIDFSYGAPYSQIRHIFCTTTEDGIASWWSQGQTLLIAVTLWFIVVLLRAKDSSWWRIMGWAVLAVFFTYMTIDDGAVVHERLGSSMRRFQADHGNNIKEYFPSYSWQYFILPFFAAMGLFMLGFLWFQLRDGLSRALLLVACGMLATAVGIDFIEGLEQGHPWNIYDEIAVAFDLDDYCQEHFREDGFESVRHLFKSAEECFMEMGANSIMWFLFIRFIIQEAATLHIHFRRNGD